MSLDRYLKQADKALERQAKATEREMIRIYSRALKEIRKKMAEIYDRLGDRVDYAEMVKYRRLEHLEDEVKEILRGLTNKNAQTLRRSLTDQYTESYFRTAFALEKEVQAKLSYTRVDPKVVWAAVQMPISGASLNERVRQRGNDLFFRVKEEIVQGLIQGESYGAMSRRLKNRLEIDTRRAITMARTESHRIQMAARLDSMIHAEEMGVRMKKVWVATLDDRTRDAHQELDGVAVGVDEDFTSPTGATGPAPGQMGSPEDDINCRCTFRIEVEGFEPKVRRVRGEGVIPHTNYEEWRQDRVS